MVENRILVAKLWQYKSIKLSLKPWELLSNCGDLAGQPYTLDQRQKIRAPVMTQTDLGATKTS